MRRTCRHRTGIIGPTALSECVGAVRRHAPMPHSMSRRHSRIPETAGAGDAIHRSSGAVRAGARHAGPARLDIAYADSLVSVELETTLAERAIHLALFCAVAVGVGLGAFAAIERLVLGGSRAVRLVHLAAAAGLVLALFVVERAYHAAL